MAYYLFAPAPYFCHARDACGPALPRTPMPCGAPTALPTATTTYFRPIATYLTQLTLGGGVYMG